MGASDIDARSSRLTDGARDEDNLIASLKSSLDGIAQALRIDDRCFHLLEPAVREPDRPHGRVEIDLFWREEH